jgi:hypothetical protein
MNEPTSESTPFSSRAAVEVCDRFFSSIDASDWDAFESCLAAFVTTDFTAFWGGDPQTTSRAELRATWTILFAGFTATPHLVGNYVAERTASGMSVHGAFRAAHFGHDPFGSPSWTLYGSYRIELVPAGDTYRIAGLHQTPTGGEGNRNIVLIAAAGSALIRGEARQTVVSSGPADHAV